MPTNNEQTPKSFDERVNEALNSNSVSEQIKTTLLVAFELVQGFDELNEHYRKDLAQFNDNFAKSNALYQSFVDEKTKFEANYEQILETLTQTSKDFQNEVARVESLKNSIEVLKNNIEVMSENISMQKKEIEKLVNSVDIAGIDERIALLNTKKDEFDAFLPQLDAKKAEFNAFVEQEKVNLEQFIAQFKDSLDEIDFVQKSAPVSGLNGQSWLDTQKGLINIFLPNERVRFCQKDEPNNYTRLGDAWYKNDEQSGISPQLLLFMQKTNGNEWHSLQMNGLDFDKIHFKQENEPDTYKNEGLSWLKMNPLNVYYLENRSFVQIDKKLVRFVSENEPDAQNETIQLNDIWKKSDNEIYICVVYQPKITQANDPQVTLIPAKATWILLEQAYQTAKFKRASLPSDDEIANDDESEDSSKVQMRDLVFVVDENELYYCVKNNYDGSDKEGYSWVKKADLMANARFQGLNEPTELFENDMWFKTKSDNLQTQEATEGVLNVLKPKTQTPAWVTLAYAKKYAAFKTELKPDAKYCKDYDAWYRPYSDELYIFYNGYFNFVNKCNAFILDETQKITQSGSVTPPAGGGGGVGGGGGAIPSEPTYIYKYKWLMRKFYGWNSRVTSPFSLDKISIQSDESRPAPELMKYSTNAVFPFIFSQYQTAAWRNGDDLLYFTKINELSDDEFYICLNVTQSFEWVRAKNQSDIKAFAWQNELEKRVSLVESLLLPDGVVREVIQKNKLIVPSYPQQLVNVAFLNRSLSTLKYKLTRQNDEYQYSEGNGIVVDDETLKVSFNFCYGKNFSVDLSFKTKTNYELVVANDEDTLINELQGQSGVIAIKGAQKLKTTLGSGFNVRVGLGGLTELEIFSYVIFENKVRLTRS